MRTVGIVTEYIPKLVSAPSGSKRVFQVLHARITARAQVHANHVEPVEIAGPAMAIDPCPGHTDDLPLLGPSDCLEWRPEPLPGSGLHLNEGHEDPSPGHQIHLEPAHAEPMLEHLPSLPLEVRYCLLLATQALLVARVGPSGGIGLDGHGEKIPTATLRALSNRRGAPQEERWLLAVGSWPLAVNAGARVWNANWLGARRQPPTANR
jgi:hypothetical protein